MTLEQITSSFSLNPFHLINTNYYPFFLELLDISIDSYTSSEECYQDFDEKSNQGSVDVSIRGEENIDQLVRQIVLSLLAEFENPASHILFGVLRQEVCFEIFRLPDYISSRLENANQSAEQLALANSLITRFENWRDNMLTSGRSTFSFS